MRVFFPVFIRFVLIATSNPTSISSATANFPPTIQATSPVSTADTTGPSTISCPAATTNTPGAASASSAADQTAGPGSATRFPSTEPASHTTASIKPHITFLCVNFFIFLNCPYRFLCFIVPNKSITFLCDWLLFFWSSSSNLRNPRS